MYSTDTATSAKPQLFSAQRHSRVHACVRTLLIALAVAAAGCGRTALEPIYLDLDAGAKDRPTERMDAPRDMAPEMAMEHPPDVAPDLAPDLPPPPPDGPVCVPKAETCNNADDDCDGDVDEDVPPIPCPGTGARFCVGGHFSECPRRCVVCVPGSKRTCITTFCTFWGSQECADDGMSFGACKESQPPAACRDVANRMMRSRELEKCCIENDFCCVDEFDLDGDGDTKEMLGRCESITCDP